MSKSKQGKSPALDAEIRLPRNVVPSHYDLTFRPDLTAFTFSGEEVVDIEVLEPTGTIKLNVKELKLKKVFVVSADGTRLDGKVTVDEKAEIATITFAGILGAGQWKFHATFDGVLNDKLKGFYRSHWTDEAGEKHTIATTQFEATDARRAFPCWDEPEFKATFSVTQVIDENLTAISNGRVISETVEKGKKTVKFAKTMKMSTYLVAFVIGEFVSSKPVNVNGKEVRIWCVPGREKLTGFALKAAAFATDWYENYFEVPYAGGDKIDHIAIPDFAAGAMENLGCITYRETALLVDEENAPHAAKVRVAVVVLHELAHMWFGDLVTMKWWNGLWLNESFATFMENLCLHHWKPEWKVWEEFALARAAASRVDALRSTHPIECPVHHPDEIDELFDVISYEKGCSVLYQLHEFIGAEVFRQGISAYLKKHAYGNTETHDLWDAFEESCKRNGLDVPARKIMDAWVFTAGHPVIEVREGDSEGTVVLTQKPFKFLPEEDASVWPVPVIMRVRKADGSFIEKKLVVGNSEETVFVGEKFDHVVVNAGGSGFYRVVYSPALNAKLTDEVGTTLDTVERFNLINDAWSTVRAGITPVEDYLGLVRIFSGESDPNVWAILTASVRHLHKLVEGDAKTSLEALARDLVTPSVERLGWDRKEGEPVQDSELRAQMISFLGTVGDSEEVQTKAAEYFDRWKADKSSVDANLAASLVGVLAYCGDKARYDEFFKLSREATNPQDTLRFLYALAGFRDTDLLQETIEKCLSADVRSQDAPFLFAALLGNRFAAPLAWDYLKSNFDRMVKAYPDSGVVRMVGSAHSLDTPDLAPDVREFFSRTKVKAGDMAIAQMLEQLDINVKLRAEQAPNLTAHLVPKQTASKS
ncbi:MAG: M1 family metallopeptidase [Cyanobacteria bacterium HKST-UBA02]|nr:M1 family metallopeptidase [Cyanobacteria bacterium HKST-UBA02]